MLQEGTGVTGHGHGHGQGGIAAYLELVLALAALASAVLLSLSFILSPETLRLPLAVFCATTWYAVAVACALPIPDRHITQAWVLCCIAALGSFAAVVAGCRNQSRWY